MNAELKSCPFCGNALEVSKRKFNPYARCVTSGCTGSKLPLLNLDIPADIEAWNARAQPSDGALTNEGAEPVEIGYFEHSKLVDAGFCPVTTRLIYTMKPTDMHLIPQHFRVLLHPQAPASVVLPERLMEILNFLTGTAGLDGFHYGDPHPSGRKFWWRNELRACLDRVKELNS